MRDDVQLVRDYLERKDEEAFAELVRRHVQIVWGAGFRVTGDAGLAQDVTQTVFAELARHASRVPEGVSLAGWLYRIAYFTAAKIVRGNARRAQREKQAMELHSLQSEPNSESAAVESLLPALDKAVSQLGEADRETVVLRFFREKTLAEIGAQLGVSEDAAQKRLSRALEKLRSHFLSRGITVTHTAVAAALGAAASQSVPPGLAATVTASSLAAAGTAGAAVGFGTFVSNLSSQIALMKTKLALSAIAVASVATPVWMQRESLADLQAEQFALQNQAALLPGLEEENAALRSRQNLADELTRLLQDHEELLQLRDEAARLRAVESEPKQRLQQGLIAARVQAEEARSRAERIRAEIDFKETRERIVHEMKNLGLAARIFATENGDRLPKSFEEMRNELASASDNMKENYGAELDLSRYEFFKHVREISEAEPELIFFREKQARRHPVTGHWTRAYTMVDGSVQQIGSETGNFDEFEAKHSVREIQ